MSFQPTAEEFVKRLHAHQSDDELKKIQRYFKTGKGEYGEGDQFMGIRMGKLFEIAREFVDMPVSEIDKLLDSPIHEVRAGALRIMDTKVRPKKTPQGLRKELFDLYLRRHDRINNWDLVDVCAPYVVGGYLIDKPRDILFELARSENLWERRTAIVGSYGFIRLKDVEDTFRLAEVLVNDKEDLIHKAVGTGLRAAGDHDQRRLLEFLDKYAATMPRTMLRCAMEHLDQDLRRHYLELKAS